MSRRLGLLGVAMLVCLASATAAGAQARVGVVGIAAEVIAVEQRLKDVRDVTVRGITFRIGTLDGREVAVGRSGTGKVNAAIVATLLVSHFDPAALLFSGTAGAIDHTLFPGDVVIGAAVAQHDTGIVTPAGTQRRPLRSTVTGELDPILLPAPPALLTAARAAAAGLKLPRALADDGKRVPRVVEGVIVTGDTFIADAGKRDELRANLGAAAVEMEGAAVVQACRTFAVPCLVIRSITDRADGSASGSYDRFRDAASENAAAVVTATITRLP